MGSIVNNSRSFVLQLQSFVAKDSRNDIREIVCRHIAWCYSLGQSLRGLDATAKLVRLISEQDLKSLESHNNNNNKPLALLQLKTLQIAKLAGQERLHLFSQIQINTSLVAFSNAMGMAERIKSTVFPVMYRIFLHFFIYVFAVTLSIALQDIESQFETLLLLVITSAFFLLERSAAHLQDPFSNKPTETAMTTIATNIEINIKQLLGDKDVPTQVQPEAFYPL